MRVLIFGDSIVVAALSGLTTYYRNITNGFFETSIRLAFNNGVEQTDHYCPERKSLD